MVSGGKKTLMKKVGKTLKKAKKYGVHKAKVGMAAAKLGGKVLNPKNAHKMIKDAIKGKGLVLPGSNYIGPGNPMGRKVMHKADANAKKHDEDYDKYIKAGVSPKKVYRGFSDADKRLMKKSNTETASGLATYLGMKGKHAMHKAGLTGKRIKDKEVFIKEKQKVGGGTGKERESLAKAGKGPAKMSMKKLKGGSMVKVGKGLGS